MIIKNAQTTLLAIVTFAFVVILMMTDFHTAKLLNNHQRELISIKERISMMESNHVQFVESVVKWIKDDESFNNNLIDRVKRADDILDGKIQKLSEFDNIVIERLKAISESQKGLIQVIIGLGATNSVDNID